MFVIEVMLCIYNLPTAAILIIGYHLPGVRPFFDAILQNETGSIVDRIGEKIAVAYIIK